MEFDPSKLAEMVGQAQQMQQQMIADLANAKVEGQAGGGMVKIEMNGNHEAVGVSIDKAAIDPDDLSLLEDLVRAAINDASRRVEEVRMEKARGVAGGLGLPSGMF